MEVKKIDQKKETKHLLEKVQTIQNFTVGLQENLEKLKQLKKDETKYSQSKQLVDIHDQSLVNLMKLRKIQRNMYIDLQKVKNHVNSEKQIVDIKQVELQSLNYKKNILQNNIKITQSLQLKDLHKLKQEKDIQSLDLINQKDEIKQILQKELQERKQNFDKLEESQKTKKRIIEQHSEKIKIYTNPEILPKYLKEACNNLKDLNKVFEVPTTKNPYQISLKQQLSPMMKNIYSNFQNYIEQSKLHDMEIFTINSSYITQHGKKYELSPHEIVLQLDYNTNQSQKSEIEQICEKNQINLNTKNIFPLKLQIREQPELNKVFIFLEKANELKTDKVFLELGHQKEYIVQESRSEYKFIQCEKLTKIALYGDEEIIQDQKNNKMEIEQQKLEKSDIDNFFDLIYSKVIRLVVYRSTQEYIKNYNEHKLLKVVLYEKIEQKEYDQLKINEENSQTNIEEEGEINETIDNIKGGSNNQNSDRIFIKFQIQNLKNTAKVGGIIQLLNDYPHQNCDIKLFNGLQESASKDTKQAITSQNLLQYNTVDKQSQKKWLNQEQQIFINEQLKSQQVLEKYPELPDLSLFSQFSTLIHYIKDLQVLNDEMYAASQKINENNQENKETFKIQKDNIKSQKNLPTIKESKE